MDGCMHAVCSLRTEVSFRMIHAQNCHQDLSFGRSKNKLQFGFWDDATWRLKIWRLTHTRIKERLENHNFIIIYVPLVASFTAGKELDLDSLQRRSRINVPWSFQL
jgi:hypothetical protein